MTVPEADAVSPTAGDSGSERVTRLVGPDVVRAVALIGVVVMNYHGYLILRGAPRGDGWLDQLFDPWEGPLSTRFAATFVLTAGIAVTLLTRRVVADRAAGRSGADAAVVEMRWRLVRRGLTLYVLGQFLDVIWPGTIIVYYGAMFVLAAGLFTLRTGWLVAAGSSAALAGWAISVWSSQRVLDGGDVGWLVAPGGDSIRRYAFDLFVNGTHPLAPWMAFFCAGIVLGRCLDRPRWRVVAASTGSALVMAAGVLSTFASTELQEVVLSVHPFDRGLLYTASALGTALLATAIISETADRLAVRRPATVDPLRRAGQMSLTIYVAHILVFNLVVDWLGWIEPSGVGTSLGFAFGFWVVAIIAATSWHRRFGRGPLERVYRHLGG
ncbi:MAG: DUF418 domain-containing protein [Ilumatobacter sp.]|uniref:DUF418 domain-containing protein n=1 Tax=Ilumatobacter sp. TaxID=1967498 RepID=UPI00391CABA4